ncbi:IS256 family transposase [Spongisporangium articulatum]|uniref:Mutator family transposase n=1 Tax=Spongisporangium articulatum TaxID=3362603 RepID=A0ABW8AU70_9ACTN
MDGDDSRDEQSDPGGQSDGVSAASPVSLSLLDQEQQQRLAEELVEQARAQGLDLIGPGGLLAGLTKRVLETALEAEMVEHLGYEAHQVAGRDGGNSRNGKRSKTVLTDLGPVEIEVPRDRDGSFEPQIVRKRQRRLESIDQIVLSLTARGLTTGEVSAHFAEVYGASVGKDQVSTITEKVVAEMTDWANRPLDRVYPVIFIDAIVVKIRDGKVTNRPVYAAIGVTVNGERDILGLWVGDGGEGAKFWLQVLTEIKNRGVDDVLILVCDGLKGLPDSVGNVWPLTTVQTCVIHLLRNSFRYAGRHDWEKIAKDLKPVYTAPTEPAAAARFEEFAEAWGSRYPAIIALWRKAWAEFVPFLDYDVEIRKIICTTNAIESLNARYRRAVRARGHFPTEQSALKCLYLVTRSLDPTGRGRARWVIRWKAALNAFAITFEGRLTPSTTN